MTTLLLISIVAALAGFALVAVTAFVVAQRTRLLRTQLLQAATPPADQRRRPRFGRRRDYSALL
jgi:hypothetical protein